MTCCGQWPREAVWAGCGLRILGSAATFARAPQCLIEEMVLPRSKGEDDAASYLVTARAFSPDWRTGLFAGGAQVWLQSVVRP